MFCTCDEWKSKMGLTISGAVPPNVNDALRLLDLKFCPWCKSSLRTGCPESMWEIMTASCTIQIRGFKGHKRELPDILKKAATDAERDMRRMGEC